MHEDFSTVIDEVKPAPVDKRKLVLLHYIGRSLRACLLVLLSSHCLGLSRSKHDSGGHTLSLLTAGHKSSRILSAGEGEKVQRSRGHPRRRLLPTAGASRSACLAVLSQALLAREGLRPLLPCCRSVGRSGLRRPPSDIPVTIRYNFLRNRPCSTSRAPDVAAFVSFTISQAPSWIGSTGCLKTT